MEQNILSDFHSKYTEIGQMRVLRVCDNEVADPIIHPLNQRLMRCEHKKAFRSARLT